MKAPKTEILIVDDNKANLRILGATFEDNCFQVNSASSVDAAQTILLSKPDSIALVLSDIQMPGLTGFDLVKWMKNENSAVKDIPILLITSQLPDTESRITGLSLGAVDYLVRTLDPKELVIRVTHAIDHYRQIKNLRYGLESQENLVTTGRLFAASNHEIKNVAQVINIAMGILTRELDSPSVDLSENGQHAFKMLQQSATLLGEVTKMIGGIIGNAVTPVGPIDLDSTVSHVVSMIRPLLKKSINLSYESHGQTWVQGSSTFLKQILINLILNARDAIDESKANSVGKIVVALSKDPESGVAVSVRDNGIGLPSAETRSEFQAFSSTKQLRGGTGLGLWLSSHLARKMDGRLTLTSLGLEKGAEARLLLREATQP